MPSCSSPSTWSTSATGSTARARDSETSPSSAALTGLRDPGLPGNRFARTWLGKTPVPLPKQYLLGIDAQKRDSKDYGQPSYLRGEWKNGGWWYYYLYGLAVKTPIGTQILLLLALFTVLLGWYRGSAGLLMTQRQAAGAPCSGRDLMVLLSPPVVLFVAVSSQLEFNHHVRYVLPALGFAFVFVGAVFLWFRPGVLTPGRDHGATG